MRIQCYLLAECLVLASALAGAGLVVRSAVRLALAQRVSPAAQAMPAQGMPAQGMPTQGMPTQGSMAGEPDLAFPPSPDVARESAGTFMGMEDDFLIARLRSQPIVRMKFNKGGSSLSFRVDLADGSRAAFKPAQTNLQTIPRKEVAAYRINRLLGLGAVPPATPRMVGRAEIFSHLHPDTVPLLPRIRTETMFDPRGNTAGVMMYWVPVIKGSGLDTPEGIGQSTRWLTQGQAIPSEKHALAAQLADLLVFDFLISNPDRYSGGNMLTTEDGSRLLFMDNTLSFFIEPQGNEKTRTALARSQRFSRRLYQALDRISEETLTHVLAQASEGDYEILTKPEIRAVLGRRDYVRKYIDGLVATYGASEVLYFP
jgi:hypothetical protein